MASLAVGCVTIVNPDPVREALHGGALEAVSGWYGWVALLEAALSVVAWVLLRRLVKGAVLVAGVVCGAHMVLALLGWSIPGVVIGACGVLLALINGAPSRYPGQPG